MKDVECPVVLVVMQPSEEIERCSGLQGVGVSSREKHDGRHFFRRALQIVQNVSAKEFDVVNSEKDRGARKRRCG